MCHQVEELRPPHSHARPKREPPRPSPDRVSSVYGPKDMELMVPRPAPVSACWGDAGKVKINDGVAFFPEPVCCPPSDKAIKHQRKKGGWEALGLSHCERTKKG